ncbi:MAG: hypothetical protein A4E19_00480 [Nitrospira sp. SG-bin1]|nr:MAG: hypothetical protein A4E19_00480 [Nitrospira sp. SG-bin1]
MKISQQLSWLLLLLVIAVMACSTGSPRELIERNDHSRLASWYEQEAVRLRGKAEEMRQMGDRYAAFAYPLSKKESKGELLRHCHDFMHYYQKAAEEAEALARLHREQEPAIP